MVPPPMAVMIPKTRTPKRSTPRYEIARTPVIAKAAEATIPTQKLSSSIEPS